MRQNIGKNRAETAFQRVKNLLALVFFFVKFPSVLKTK